MVRSPGVAKDAHRPVVEAGTRESALCTLANIDSAIAELREVRKNVRGDHKHRIDDAIVIFKVIALETQQMFGISDAEADEFVQKNHPSFVP